MSTTPRFVHIGYFPQAWCGMGDGSGASLPYVDNLTLAQAMAFVWSLENFVLDTTGSAANTFSAVDASNTFVLNAGVPFASAFDEASGGGLWNPGPGAEVPWSSWPPNRIPKERVCAPALSSGLGLVFSVSAVNTLNAENAFSLSFELATDPLHSGKYRMFYRFFIVFVSRFDPTNFISIVFSEVDSGGDPYSGTITIGGITFNWWSHIQSVGSAPLVGTPPSMSASSSDYTYV
jgi:hypothetical protein